MKKLVLLSLLILIFNNAFNLKAQSHKIDITISDVKDTSIILGYYFNKQIFVQDTAYTNSKGMCSFASNKPLDQGLYVVYLPDKTYFDLLIGSEQNMKITTQKGDLINAAKLTGSAQSLAFLDYQRFLISKQKEAATIQDSLKTNEGNKVKTDALKAQLNALSTQVLDYWKTVEAKYPNTFLTAFLKGLQDIEAMFFSNQNVYSWYPTEEEYLELKTSKYKRAAFKSHTDQSLPAYMTEDPELFIIDRELK